MSSQSMMAHPKAALKKFGHVLRHEETVIGYLFVLPTLLAFVAFKFYPLVYAAQLSFTDWNGFSPTREYVGLSNYSALGQDDRFLRALSNTAYFAAGYIPLAMMAGLATALILDQKLRGRSFFRTLFYIPNITPSVASAVIWVSILNPDWGMLNWVLGKLHLPTPSWLGDPKWAMPGIIIYSVWRAFGYHMIIYLAGLQSIPGKYYEAARIDGAGRWHLFRHITWPLLTPTTFFLLVTSVIGSFQVFSSVLVITQGGPAGATSVLVYRIYQHAFEFFEMGYATAMSYVLFAIILVFTLLQFRLSLRHVHYVG